MKLLDYSPLQKHVTYADARKQVKFSLTSKVNIGVSVVVVALVFGMGIVFMATSGKTALFIFTSIFVFTAALTALISFVMLNTAKSKVKLIRFAEANGVEVSFEKENPTFGGMYFQVGNDRELIASIDIPESNIKIGTYKYTIQTGKSSVTKTVGFARFPLTRNLPHIVLDNKQNNFWKISNLPAFFDQDQRLSLEGNFDSHFTLYAPKSYERDALYIFTPDVMATFIDNGYAFDAEIVDNYLFVYTQKKPKLTDPTFISTIYRAVEALGTKLEKQSDYYMDERVASREANIIAPEGKRLKPGFSIFFAIPVVIYVGMQLLKFTEETNINPVTIFSTAVVVGIIVWVVIVNYRKTKK